MLYCGQDMMSTDHSVMKEIDTHPINQGTDVLVNREVAIPRAEARREPRANSYISP